MRQAYTATDTAQAEELEALLEERGIEVETLTSGSSGLPALWVCRDEDLERAQEIIAEALAPRRDSEAVPDEGPPAVQAGGAHHTSTVSREGAKLEVLLVLLFFALPLYWGCIQGFVWPHSVMETSVGYVLVFDTLFLAKVVAILLLSARVVGEQAKVLGICPPRWREDLLLGVFILIVHYGILFISNVTLAPILEQIPLIPATLDYPYIEPANTVEYLALGISMVVISFAEELLVRGYLLTRLEILMRSSVKAVVISSFLFGLWHAYQGSLGVLDATLGGLLYGTMFCWIRRIWPVAIAHALFNLALIG